MDKVRVTVDKEKKKGDKIECQLEDGRVAKITVPHKSSNFWKYKKGNIRQLVRLFLIRNPPCNPNATCFSRSHRRW